jgi:hypothetical protein
LEIESHEQFTRAATLPISAFQVTRITGVSHQNMPTPSFWLACRKISFLHGWKVVLFFPEGRSGQENLCAMQPIEYTERQNMSPEPRKRKGRAFPEGRHVAQQSAGQPIYLVL